MYKPLRALAIVLFLGLTSLFLFQQRYVLLSHQRVIDEASLDRNSHFDPYAKFAVFDNKQLSAGLLLSQQIYSQEPQLKVLGEKAQIVKRIEVDLTHQKIYALENDKVVMEFLISSGKWGKTPTGTFTIWTKLRYTKMEGGSQALGTYYYLPNVPYTMFFYNQDIPKHRGFGIHGAYWHDNFGQPMSHGCINMRTEDVAMLFYWADPDLQGKKSIYASEDNPGTTVYIYGTAPQS